MHREVGMAVFNASLSNSIPQENTAPFLCCSEGESTCKQYMDKHIHSFDM